MTVPQCNPYFLPLHLYSLCGIQQGFRGFSLIQGVFESVENQQSVRLNQFKVSTIQRLIVVLNGDDFLIVD